MHKGRDRSLAVEFELNDDAYSSQPSRKMFFFVNCTKLAICTSVKSDDEGGIKGMKK
jgi:hypothetical protein